MRHAAMILIAGFLVVVACGGCSDDDDPLPGVVQRWSEAVLAGDPGAVAALHTEDGTWYDRALKRVFQSREQIDFGLRAGFPFLTVENMDLLSCRRTGDTIRTEWRWEGTSSTHARAPDDQTPFSAEVEFVFVLEDDLIASTEFSYQYASVFN